MAASGADELANILQFGLDRLWDAAVPGALPPQRTDRCRVCVEVSTYLNEIECVHAQSCRTRTSRRSWTATATSSRRSCASTCVAIPQAAATGIHLTPPAFQVAQISAQSASQAAAGAGDDGDVDMAAPSAAQPSSPGKEAKMDVSNDDEGSHRVAWLCGLAHPLMLTV